MKGLSVINVCGGEFNAALQVVNAWEFEKVYATENSHENFMLLADAYVNAERIEEVKKGMAFIERVLDEDRQRNDLLFHLACGQVRCGEYKKALATADECLEIDEGFWKAKALREIIKTALSSQESRRMKGLGYGALTAVAAAAGGIALLWSSPKMKMLRTMTLPEWKEAFDLVDKIEERMVEHMAMGVGVGAVSVGILVVGFFTVLAKHMAD
ncbi:mitochondrial fission 1 protein A-like protein [Tanacetum coccineum]